MAKCCRIGPNHDGNACVRSGTRKPHPALAFTRGLVAVFSTVIDPGTGCLTFVVFSRSLTLELLIASLAIFDF
jgi:hypothetical protein